MLRLQLVGLLVVAACAPAPQRPLPATPQEQPFEQSSEAGGDVGILVMAHGGSEVWNKTVADAVAELPTNIPTVVSYGMANPRTLRAGLEELSSRGVRKVAVVRVFVSGQSFLEQTEYLLGLREDRPAQMVLMGMDPATVWPIEHEMEIATHLDGLMVSEEARTILADRARGASLDPGQESVLLVAHGMGDDVQNSRVLAAMDRVTRELDSTGFSATGIATLREDWADKREAAEDGIREFVADEALQGKRVIVVPVRLSGFGPYAEVLGELEYVATEGLLPHPEVSTWIGARARDIICAQGWQAGSISCPRVVAPPTR